MAPRDRSPNVNGVFLQVAMFEPHKPLADDEWL